MRVAASSRSDRTACCGKGQRSRSRFSRAEPSSGRAGTSDRKSTRLNSSHTKIYTLSYTTLFRSGCRVRGAVAIGERTELYDGVVIGNPGQFPGRHARGGLIEIGPDCVLREGTTVTQPVLTGRTVVGPGSYL